MAHGQHVDETLFPDFCAIGFRLGANFSFSQSNPESALWRPIGLPDRGCSSRPAFIQQIVLISVRGSWMQLARGDLCVKESIYDVSNATSEMCCPKWKGTELTLKPELVLHSYIHSLDAWVRCVLL